jgi:hypothetical protein
VSLLQLLDDDRGAVCLHALSDDGGDSVGLESVLRLQASAGWPLTATSGPCFRLIYLVSERTGCLDRGGER